MTVTQKLEGLYAPMIEGIQDRIAIPKEWDEAIDKTTDLISFLDESGKALTFSPGQRLIANCILNRKAPDGRRRIEILTTTQYGKSLTVGDAVAVRACTFSESWAIIAGTRDKAKIIMDYIIDAVVSDPLLRQQLVFDGSIDKLKAEKSKNRLTFRRGGEVRVFSADVKNKKELGRALMGFGSTNIVLDEAALVPDAFFAKILRMLGGKKDGFLMKIGNPFERNHFLSSWRSDRYFKVWINYKQAIAEGRLTQEFIDEAREDMDEQTFNIFYEAVFPDGGIMDAEGYMQLLTEDDIARAEVTSMEHTGWKRAGWDFAGGGGNLTVGAIRSSYYANYVFEKSISDPTLIQRAVIEVHEQEIHKEQEEIAKTPILINNKSYGDQVGVGFGIVGNLKPQVGMVGVNAGWEPDDKSLFTNKRAEMFWRLRMWVLSGGKLQRHRKNIQLAKIKFKHIEEGSKAKIQLMPKLLMIASGTPSPDHADSLSFTFFDAEPNPKDYEVLEDEYMEDDNADPYD